MHGRAGVRNGVGIGNADLIFMPLTPKLAAVPLVLLGGPK